MKQKSKIKAVLLFVFMFCVFQFSFPHPAHTVTRFERMDIWLTLLLGDETDPFFPDTVRHDFLRYGIKKVGGVCNIAGFRKVCKVYPSTGSIFFVGSVSLPDWTNEFHSIIDYDAVWKGDSSLALQRIKSTDVARVSIYTSEEIQYWFTGDYLTGEPRLYVYPAPADTDTVIVFGHGIPKDSYVNPAYDHLVVIYALYLCYQQQREGEIAKFIKSIFDSLLQDMYVITEGKTVDVTIKEKVISQ